MDDIWIGILLVAAAAAVNLMGRDWKKLKNRGR